MDLSMNNLNSSDRWYLHHPIKHLSRSNFSHVFHFVFSPLSSYPFNKLGNILRLSNSLRLFTTTRYSSLYFLDLGIKQMLSNKINLCRNNGNKSAPRGTLRCTLTNRARKSITILVERRYAYGLERTECVLCTYISLLVMTIIAALITLLGRSDIFFPWHWLQQQQ